MRCETNLYHSKSMSLPTRPKILFKIETYNNPQTDISTINDSENLNQIHSKSSYHNEKTLNESSNRIKNFPIPTEDKSYQFTFKNCRKRFLSKGQFTFNFNNFDGKQYICIYPGCQKKYPSISRLRTHIRTHTGEKPFSCPYPQCNKSFNEKGNLKTHIRIHTGEKPFECSFEGCGKKFKAKGHLSDHMKIHFKLKPFKCNICGNTFSRSSTLKIHSYTHSNYRPFKCPFQNCDKGFTEKGNMKAHLRTHLKKLYAKFIKNKKIPYQLYRNINVNTENFDNGEREDTNALNLSSVYSLILHLNQVTNNYHTLQTSYPIYIYIMNYYYLLFYGCNIARDTFNNLQI